jgi:cardiolipin synthase
MRNQICFPLVRKIKTVAVASILLALLVLPSCSPIADPVDEDIDIDTSLGINKLLDQYTDTQLTGGSNMELLIDGPVSRQAYTDLMNNATETICVEMWSIDDDSEMPENIGQEFVDLMIARASQGVTVNVIVDGSAMKFYSNTDLVNQLRAGGVNVRGFVPPLDKILVDQALYHSHKKFAVADGKAAVLGGMNFGYHYMGADQWRDTNVYLSGPVVADLQREFLDNWAALGDAVADETPYFPTLESTGDLSIRIVGQNPTLDDFDLNQSILIALRCATDHVDLEAPYFNPNPALEQELFDAVTRGVRVRILTNSQASVDIPSMFCVTASYFQEMLDGGVEIYLWNLEGRTIHSKSMVVDDQFAYVGSFNFNYRSIVWDAEIAAVFTDADPVGQIQDMIDYDLGRDFIVPITQEWIDAQSEDDKAEWDVARAMELFL